MLSQIEEKHETLMGIYNQHRQTVYELQALLREEALPQLMEEVNTEEISVNVIEPWILNWIDDCGSIFRTLKKNKFDNGRTKTALQRTLRWRLFELPEFMNPKLSSSFIECLPNGVHDILGRPILLLRPGKLDDTSSQSKSAIVSAHEEMRKRLCFEKHDNPSLQFVMIVDAKDISMRSMAVDLISWLIKEVAPHFPGICGAAFIVNNSWTYGVYNIMKRLLPATALARIYFPTGTELHECFEKEHLLREYGGDLVVSEMSMTLSHKHGNFYELPYGPPRRSPSNVNLSIFLSSMSALNPYFGYPVVSNPGSSVPSLKNGRRRKRDLARTLFRLWLVKLKKWTDKTWLWIVMSIALWAVGVKDWN